MSTIQEYYGEYYAEETNDVVDLTGVDSEVVPPLIMCWGIVPALDIISGLWIMNDWSDAELGVWNRAWYTEVGFGLINLTTWGRAVFMGDEFSQKMFVVSSQAHILVEAVMLYFVYDADKAYPNDVFVHNDSTNFAYAAHIVGLGYTSTVAFTGTVKNFYAVEDEAVEEEYS